MIAGVTKDRTPQEAGRGDQALSYDAHDVVGGDEDPSLSQAASSEIGVETLYLDAHSGGQVVPVESRLQAAAAHDAALEFPLIHIATAQTQAHSRHGSAV
jgi:hypothetical protein